MASWCYPESWHRVLCSTLGIERMAKCQETYLSSVTAEAHMQSKFVGAVSILALLCAGCGGSGSDAATASPAITPTAPSTTLWPTATLTSVAYTYNGSGGNRIVAGRGALPNATVIDIALDGVPRWLLSARRSDLETVWVCVLADGRVVGYVLNGDRTIPIAISPATIDASLQPTLALDDKGAAYLLNIVDVHTPSGSTTTAVQLSTKKSAHVDTSGNLILRSDAGDENLSLNALPNTRILVDEQERLLLLADPSDRYSHDVLHGNSIANSVVFVATQPKLQVIKKIEMPAPKVIEGNGLIWADMNGDGQRDIIVTVSDSTVGSALMVYSEQGALLAAGAPIGTGFRWHHQVAVAPFMTSNVPELAVTRTPHIGGVTEFYHIEGPQLISDSAKLGYTSHHESASDNIDMSLAGDFDGDSQMELLVPSEDFTRLGAIAHFGANDVRRKWEVQIGGELMTNVSAVNDGAGHLIVGVGHSNKGLRIWRDPSL